MAEVFKTSDRSLYAIGYSVRRVKAGQPVRQEHSNRRSKESGLWFYKKGIAAMIPGSVVKGKNSPEAKKITDA